MAQNLILGDLLANIADVTRKIDGSIWNSTTQSWEPATPASKAAAQTAVNAAIGAMVATIPAPLTVGSLVISKAAIDTAVAAITSAMGAYAVATTKI